MTRHRHTASEIPRWLARRPRPTPHVLDADTVGVVAHPRTKRNPLGAGRAPRAGAAASQKLTIRVTDAERARYAAAAEAAGQTLGEWLRAAAEDKLKRKRRA